MNAAPLALKISARRSFFPMVWEGGNTQSAVAASLCRRATPRLHWMRPNGDIAPLLQHKNMRVILKPFGCAERESWRWLASNVGWLDAARRAGTGNASRPRQTGRGHSAHG